MKRNSQRFVAERGEQNTTANGVFNNGDTLKKWWSYIKENVTAFIAITTAILAACYAVLRFIVFTFTLGFFHKLNIDVNIMKLDFDISIFTVLFIALIVLTFGAIVLWICNYFITLRKIENIKRGRKISICLAIMIISLFLLLIFNIPLVLVALTWGEMDIIWSNIERVMLLFLVLEIISIVIIFVARIRKEKRQTRLPLRGYVVIGIFAVSLVAAIVFYMGSSLKVRMERIRLVKGGEYMISYCDREHYLLHRVDFNDGKLIIYRNMQRIIDIDECEITVEKGIKEIIISDSEPENGEEKNTMASQEELKEE